MGNGRTVAKRPHSRHAPYLRHLADQVVGKKPGNFAAHAKGDYDSKGGRSGGTSSGFDRASLPNFAGTRDPEEISRRQWGC